MQTCTLQAILAMIMRLRNDGLVDVRSTLEKCIREESVIDVEVELNTSM